MRIAAACARAPPLLLLLLLLLLQQQELVLPGLFRIESEPEWSFVSSSGISPWLYKAVSLVDMNQFGSTGDFVPYECVLLRVNGSEKNVTGAAEDSYRGDVVVGKYSIKAVGDALLLGGAQPPLTSYFWLEQLGHGGAIEWSYSTGAGSWSLVNGRGRPGSGTVLGSSGQFDLDRGDDYAPADDTGMEVAGNPNANRATWWRTAGNSGGATTPIPANLTKMTVPGGGSTPLYWLRGKVTQTFATPPVINQVYDRPDFGELLARKYGGKQQWAEAMAQRLRNWGFTAVGQYSYAYWDVAQKLNQTMRLPSIRSWQLSGWAERGEAPGNASTGPAKVVYDGAVCPPGSTKQLWQGTQPDVWDPSYLSSLKSGAAANQGGSLTDEWAPFLVVDEADDLFGFDKQSHTHMGYAVLSQNPYHPHSIKVPSTGLNYSDPRLFAKYALRDFLRDRYRADNEQPTVVSSTLPPFDFRRPVPQFKYANDSASLAALANLNKAWNTSYITWDTAAGNIRSGTAAWGKGLGFMDEDGRAAYNDTCRLDYVQSAKQIARGVALWKDLDDFVAASAQRYGYSVRVAINASAVSHNRTTHVPLAFMIYDGPTWVYAMLAPYADLFVTSTTTTRLTDIYAASGRPVVDVDYTTATPDSGMWAQASIELLEFNVTNSMTQVRVPGFKYRWRKRRFVTWPDAGGLFRSGTPPFGGCHGTAQQCPCGYLTSSAPISYVQWDTLRWNHDYVNVSHYGECVHSAEPIQIASTDGGSPLYSITSQEQRAKNMSETWLAKRNLRGPDGKRFVIGFEHWALHDPQPSNWLDDENFGLLTSRDNAYDGVEARREQTIVNGKYVGGEYADYGNLMHPLSAFLRELKLDDDEAP